MSFIDDIRKTTSQVGKIIKDTYGPLDPLLKPLEAGIYRYPLDVGSTQRYPHTVEFQTWIPSQSQIDDIGVAKSAKDSILSGYNATIGKAVGEINNFSNFVQEKTGVNLGKYTPNTVNIQEDPYNADMMRVDRNKQYNDRLLEFKRRSTRSDVITMYLPQGTWNDRINNAYQQQSMTAAFGGLGGVVDVGGSIIKKLSENGEAGRQLAWDMINGPAGMEVLGNIAGGMGMDGGVLRDAGLTALGYALNPQFEILYSGTDLREFQFDFTMTPRSADEAEMIRKIIKKFKYHGSPAYVAGQGRYIVPPSYFDITFNFNGNESEWLPSISTCVLKSLDVDYTGGLEQWASHEDGSPIQVRLVMVFVELEMMHKKLRKQGY